MDTMPVTPDEEYPPAVQLALDVLQKTIEGMLASGMDSGDVAAAVALSLQDCILDAPDAVDWPGYLRSLADDYDQTFTAPAGAKVQ